MKADSKNGRKQNEIVLRFMQSVSIRPESARDSDWQVVVVALEVVSHVESVSTGTSEKKGCGNRGS